MDAYKHEQIDLEGPAFRLLRLHKGSGVDIECELFQGWLQGDNAISYEALSYTWGSTELSASVNIMGRTLDVTENLYLALQHLRLQETDRIIWVDAICIDQSNMRERGHQVQQMGTIYSRADRVVIWLGSATDDTDIVMDSLKRLEVESTRYAHQDWKQSDKRWMELWSSVQLTPMGRYWGTAIRQRAGLQSLLGRPWFKRVWILQEVANAKRAVLCCGTKSVSARIFALAPVLLDTKPVPHCQAVLDIMPGPTRKDSWWSQRRDLYTLLLKFNGSKAGDPRDMVYALLGISSDAKDADDLRADYTKELQQVVYDTASFLFGLSDVPHRTISELIADVSLLNTASLSQVAKAYNAGDVDDFLTRRREETMITMEVIKAAAENEKYGKQVMQLLLQQCGSELNITQEVVKVAARNPTNGREIVELLFQHWGGEVKVTEEVLMAAAGNQTSGTEVTELLLQRGGKVKVTEAVVKAAAGNEKYEAKIIQFLLQQQRSKVKISKKVVKAVARNLISGREVIELSFQQRGSEVKVIEEIFQTAARNPTSRTEVIQLLLQ